MRNAAKPAYRDARAHHGHDTPAGCFKASNCGFQKQPCCLWKLLISFGCAGLHWTRPATSTVQRWSTGQTSARTACASASRPTSTARRWMALGPHASRKLLLLVSETPQDLIGVTQKTAKPTSTGRRWMHQQDSKSYRYCLARLSRFTGVAQNTATPTLLGRRLMRGQDSRKFEGIGGR